METRIVSAIVAAIVSLGFAGTAGAQTTTYPVLLSNTFTFSGYPTSQPGTVVSITSYDGNTPANPPDGAQAQFPYHMGSVELSNAGISGISVPFELGYLNNGDLEPCDPGQWGAKNWIVGDGSLNTPGTYTVTASTTCPYFTGEWGTYLNSNNRLDGFNVTATYTREIVPSCGRFGCRGFHPVDTLQGGTGTITEWDITPPPSTPGQ